MKKFKLLFSLSATVISTICAIYVVSYHSANANFAQYYSVSMGLMSFGILILGDWFINDKQPRQKRVSPNRS